MVTLAPPAGRTTAAGGANAANGQLALAFYRHAESDYRPSSLQLVRFEGDRVVEMMSFIGPGYLRGFEVPDHLPLA